MIFKIVDKYGYFIKTVIKDDCFYKIAISPSIGDDEYFFIHCLAWSAI